MFVRIIEKCNIFYSMQHSSHHRTDRCASGNSHHTSGDDKHHHDNHHPGSGKHHHGEHHPKVSDSHHHGDHHSNGDDMHHHGNVQQQDRHQHHHSHGDCHHSHDNQVTKSMYHVSLHYSNTSMLLWRNRKSIFPKFYKVTKQECIGTKLIKT